MELNAQRTQTIYLRVHDSVRQTELGNTVFEHSAYLMQSLEDMYFVTVFGSIAGKSQTGRPTTNDRYFSARCDL